MMKPILTDKHLDTLTVGLNESTSLIGLEGTVRSTKTVFAIQLFYFAVKNSKEKLHCLAAKDYDAIRDNLLECNGYGLTDGLFPDVRMVRDKIGGYYLVMDGIKKDQKKKILVAGYSDKHQWKKILGKTIGVFLIDEANTADETFIDETFARQVSVDHPLTIMTLNGDNPQHFIYQKYLNYCKPLFKVPQSILFDMNKFPKKKGWYYTHWTFKDNPIMTKEKIERAMEIYPVGSYYYTIKILGERGTAEGMVYDIFVKNMQSYIINNIDDFEFASIVIGVDFGGNGSAHTFVATGYGKDFKYIVHLESERVEATGTTADDLADAFEKFVRMVIAKYRWQNKAMECYCDSAEQTLKNSLKFRSESKGLPLIVKNAQKKQINDRIQYQLKLFSSKVLFFNFSAKSCIEAYRTARYSDKQGHLNERLDDGTSDIDTMDASEYTLEPYMKIVQQLLEVRE